MLKKIALFCFLCTSFVACAPKHSHKSCCCSDIKKYCGKKPKNENDKIVFENCINLNKSKFSPACQGQLEKHSKVQKICKNDLQKHCSSSDNVQKCVEKNKVNFSEECKAAMNEKVMNKNDSSDVKKEDKKLNKTKKKKNKNKSKK